MSNAVRGDDESQGEGFRGRLNFGTVPRNPMTASAPPNPFSWSTRRLAVAVFVAGTATALVMVFLGWRVQHFVDNRADPYGFAAIAHSLLHGEGFAPYGSVLNRRGPLYPAMIALVYAVAGEHPMALQVVQSFMLGGICALVFDVGRRLYSARTGLLAGILCAVYPTIVRYVADFHLETFLAFLCTLALWRSVIFMEKPSPKNGALFGVCIGLGALTKPVVLLYPVVFAAFWLWTQRPWKKSAAAGHPAPEQSGERAEHAARNALVRKLVAAGAIFVAMGVVILPWTYRNYRTSGHFVLVTTGAGDAFLRGFVFSKPDYALLRLPPYTFAENESNVMFTEICRREGAVWTADDIETERILVKASKAKLAADPGGFVVKYFTQLFTFWYQMTSLANSLVAGLGALALWILAMVGWRRARAEGRASWPLYLPILCLNLSLAALLALGRYSVPVLPALIILAAFGIDTLLPRPRAED